MKALLIFSLLATVAFGRLGETEPQLIDRYGNVRIRLEAPNTNARVEISVGDTLVFQVDGWTIAAVLIDGRCESISYSKRGEWTEEQLVRILESNGGRGRWVEQTNGGSDSSREWLCRSRAAAVWQKSEGLKLTTTAYERRCMELRQARRETSKLSRL